MLFSNAIIAQVRFNKSYSYQQYNVEATSAVELGDGYLISEKIILVNDSAVALGIRKIDLQGNSIWYKVFSYPGKQLIPSKNAMHINTNGDVWISCTYSDSLITGNPSDGLWMKINTNGDSLTSFIFGGINSDRVYNSIIDTDGNLIIAGAKYIAPNKDNPWAIKFDQNGNLIWENQQNNSNYTRHFEAVVQDENGDYFFVGLIKLAGTNILRSKINYDGTNAWIKPIQTSNVQNGKATGLATLQNDLIITGNNRSGSTEVVAYNYYDTAGNYIDFREFGHSFLKSNLYTNPLLIDSNSFAVAGRNQKHEIDSAYWGWFLNFQYPDSMIWDRTYHYNHSSDHLFNDLKRTSDGGFILCGFNKNDSLNVNNSWVVKLDSNGCDVPGCELLGTNDFQNKELKIQIFPNPAQNFIDIKIKGTNNKHLVQIYGIDGVFLKETLVADSDRIPLDNFANGIYLLKVSDINGSDKPLYQKFIVNN